MFRVRYIPPANPFGREGVITNPTNASVRTGRRATEALCGEYNRSVDIHPSHIMREFPFCHPRVLMIITPWPKLLALIPRRRAGRNYQLGWAEPSRSARASSNHLYNPRYTKNWHPPSLGARASQRACQRPPPAPAEHWAQRLQVDSLAPRRPRTTGSPPAVRRRPRPF